MTDQHPITPPDELKKQWMGLALSWQETLNIAARWGADQQLKLDAEQIAHAYQAGADQELEACCVLMDEWGLDGEDLMQCRRPKLPSLKEQALARTDAILNEPNRALLTDVRETLELNRRALEALPND